MNSNKTTRQIFLALLFIASVYFFIRLIQYHYKLITFPYQLELRETAIIETTDLIKQGKNPYSFELQPQYTNVYGFVYNYTVIPFLSIFKKSIEAHRFVTGIYIWLSLILIFYILIKRRLHWIFALNGTVFMYAIFLYTVQPISRPDSLGTLLFLLGIFIPFLWSFSSKSLWICLISGIISYYTKAYFVVCIPYILGYVFLFVSKRKAILFSFIFLFLFVGSMFVVDKLYPGYLYNTILIPANAATYTYDSILRQLNGFFLHQGMTMTIVFVIVLIVEGLKVYRKIKGNDLIKVSELFRKFLRKVKILPLDHPFISIKPSLFLYCAICSFLLFIIKMGGHGGNYLTYLLELFVPFYIIFIYERIRYYNLYVICSPLLIIALFGCYSFLGKAPQYPDKNWDKVTSLLSNHNKILSSGSIGCSIFEQGKEVVDNGQGEYFIYGLRKKMMKKSFKREEEVKKQFAAFQERVEKNVRSKQYDIIFSYPSNPWIISEDSIKRYYTKYDSVHIDFSQNFESLDLEVWKPGR